MSIVRREALRRLPDCLDLSDDVEGFRQHFIRRRHNSRVCRIGLLGDDQLGKLLRNISIGGLQGVADNRPGRAELRWPRRLRLRKCAAVQPGQSRIRVEGNEWDFSDRKSSAIGIGRIDLTAGAKPDL